MLFRSVIRGFNYVRPFSSTKNVSVTVEEKSGIATITLQRPPVNSLNLELLSELSSALTEVEKNKCRGAILGSAQNSVFSAGLDITELYKPDEDRLKKFWGTLQDVWIKLYGSSYPTVACITGHAPAGGCLLSLSCEYRVMVDGFTIGLNETKLGIIAPSWFIASMKNAIGDRHTELSLTAGKMYKTNEAKSIGLVDKIVSNREEAVHECVNFLSQFKGVSPMARHLTKKALRGESIQDLINNREKDTQTVVNLITQEKVQKGIHMYLEQLKKK